MKDFLQLKKNLKKDRSALKKLKLAILGDTSTQFLVQAIEGLGIDYGYNLETWEADFNQIERQVFDSNSELYEFQPDIVIVFQSTHKLLGKYNKQNIDQYQYFAQFEIENIERLYNTLSGNSMAKVIFYNFPELNDSVFGNFSNQLESSFLFQLRKLNFELMQFASRNSNLYLCDISSIQNQVGKAKLFQPSIYINSEMVFSIESLPYVATSTLNLIDALNGKIKKCLILDLDNTLWGGVIGDDGLENIQIGGLGIGKAFSEFQYWIKKLKNRGIILAVCSKNTESVAKEPFEKHPDMILRLEDISVFVANWNNKADNIRYIQSILNIGFDSMVFLDDNPFERNIVRENLPEVCVPELPEDPAEYLEFLYNENLFETISFSNEDIERTKLYQIEAKRAVFQQNCTNEEEFLSSLNMISVVSPFTKFNIPRVAQLSQRSNQFNLRTMRYTEGDIEKMAIDDNFHPFTFTLEDKYGDYGLICVVILKKESANNLFIDTWFMSCRVLKRGMENFVLNTIVEYAQKNDFEFIKGEYIPTLKNEMVRNHYENLGFEGQQSYWVLNVNNYQPKNNFITAKNIR